MASGWAVCRGLPAQFGVKVVHGFSLLGQAVQNLFSFGPRVQDFLGLRIPKMSLWPVWARNCSKSKLLKGVLTGSRKPRFSRTLGVLSVLHCLPTLGTKGTCFFVGGPNNAELFCVWTKSTQLSHAQDTENGHLATLGRKSLKVNTFRKSFNRKSQAKIFKNSGCTVCLGLPAQFGG